MPYHSFHCPSVGPVLKRCDSQDQGGPQSRPIALFPFRPVALIAQTGTDPLYTGLRQECYQAQLGVLLSDKPNPMDRNPIQEPALLLRE